jgi:hypothetical protein
LSDRYYVRFRGRVLGPFNGEKTAEMVRRGQVTRVHELSPDGLTWKKAEEFTEFFPKANSTRAATVQAEKLLQPEPTKAEVMPAEVQWHVHCDGQEYGPMAESALVDWIRQGRVRGDSMVWRSGMNEWAPAESVQPTWFAGQLRPVQQRMAASAIVDSDSQSEDLDQKLTAETTSKLPWIYFMAVSIIIIGTLSSIGAAILFLQGVAVLNENRNLGTVRLIFGFMAGIQAIMTLLGGVFLLRYANALSMLRTIPTVSNAIIAAKRLSGFWFLSSFYVLLFMSFLLFALLIEILAEATV